MLQLQLPMFPTLHGNRKPTRLGHQNQTPRRLGLGMTCKHIIDVVVVVVVVVVVMRAQKV